MAFCNFQGPCSTIVNECEPTPTLPILFMYVFLASLASHSQLGRTKTLQSLHSTKLRVGLNQGNKEDDFNFSSFKLQSLLYRQKIWFFLNLVKALARLQNTKVQGQRQKFGASKFLHLFPSSRFRNVGESSFSNSTKLKPPKHSQLTNRNSRSETQIFFFFGQMKHKIKHTKTVVDLHLKFLKCFLSFHHEQITILRYID